MNNTSTRKTT